MDVIDAGGFSRAPRVEPAYASVGIWIIFFWMAY